MCVPVISEPQLTIRRDFSRRKKRRPERSISLRYMIVGSLSRTAIAGALLKKIIGKHLESLAIMACPLIMVGIVMWIVDASMNARIT